MKQLYTLGSLFDGIGGFPYAASFYGIQTLWASEVLPECISVTTRHFPKMVHVGDITRLDGHALPPVDVITFGSPCQDLSVAGRREGLAGARSGLFMEAIRIIRGMREVTNGEYPKITIWENVPGALSSSGGYDFKTVLKAFTKIEIPMPSSHRWANAGMVRGGSADLAWVLYDAQYFGTAQRRRRLFLIADFRAKRAGEILFVPKSLQRYFAAGGTPRQSPAANPKSSAGAAGRGSVTMRLRSGCEGGGKGPLLQDERSGTLATRNDQYLFEPSPVIVLNDQGGDSISTEKTEISPTLRGQTHGNLPIVTMHTALAGTLCASGAGLSRPAGMGSETDFCIVSNFRVRRLTPVECERLQGYPDNWTAYGANKRLISDTKRYKMLGNSVAVPCVAYVMQGVVKALDGGR